MNGNFRWIRMFKIAVSVESIICYLTILAVISYARGPVRYAYDEKPLLTSEDFISFSGENGGHDGVLWINNTKPGDVVGWQNELDLGNVEEIAVSFTIDCPADYSGVTLVTDLFDQNSGYDSSEQEFQLVLHEGTNEASFVISPGKTHPASALFRFFTTELGVYEIRNIEIQNKITLPRVPTGLKYVLAVISVAVIVTWVTGPVLKKTKSTV